MSDNKLLIGFHNMGQGEGGIMFGVMKLMLVGQSIIYYFVTRLDSLEILETN